MENDILFIVQFNRITKELKLDKIDNARSNPVFSINAVPAQPDTEILIKSAFMNPVHIITSFPQSFICKKPFPPIPVKVLYGYLYHGKTIQDTRNLANKGWHVPTDTEWNTLRDYYQQRCGTLKETGTTHWEDPNTEATNESGLTIMPNGMISNYGQFDELNRYGWLWSSTFDNYGFGIYQKLSFNSYVITSGYLSQKYGFAVRLVKDSTTLQHGQYGTYKGNDNKIYPSICIGPQEWIIANLAETKFRNGDDIPQITSRVEWANLNAAGRCAFNFNADNVLQS